MPDIDLFSFRITGATRLLSWIPDSAGFTFSCSWVSRCLASILQLPHHRRNAPAFLDSGFGRIYLQLQLSFPLPGIDPSASALSPQPRLLPWIPDSAGFTFSCS
ncbi:hypothetical protein [Bacillus subtilis]|uniref:hypothetical protein n=1 Tax=Bacillus subtilis TaxID=1423 RepID=UPI003F6E3540